MIEACCLTFLPKSSPNLTGLRPPPPPGEAIRDRTNLLWVSIDNYDSRDLDQLTVAEAMPGDKVKILVAIADVDSIVKKGSAVDDNARHNTTSVYTAATIFPMLPEKLSTDLTSLNFNADRLSMVIEMVIGPDGSLQGSDVYRALTAIRRSFPITAWPPGWRGMGLRRKPSRP